MDKLLSYVNSTMREVNELTDELYEAMIDSDRLQIIEICKKMSKLISDIKKSHNSEDVF
jgi:hypothetical protein